MLSKRASLTPDYRALSAGSETLVGRVNSGRRAARRGHVGGFQAFRFHGLPCRRCHIKAKGHGRSRGSPCNRRGRTGRGERSGRGGVVPACDPFSIGCQLQRRRISYTGYYALFI
jgi:hypothetical protein